MSKNAQNSDQIMARSERLTRRQQITSEKQTTASKLKKKDKNIDALQNQSAEQNETSHENPEMQKNLSSAKESPSLTPKKRTAMQQVEPESITKNEKEISYKNSNSDSDSNHDIIAENSASHQNKSHEYADLGDDQHFFNELPPDFYLQQALIRKRDTKGGYKAKLALEKLVLDYERKRALLSNLMQRQEQISQQLDILREQAGVKINAQEESKGPASKTHHEFLIKEMIWMQEDFERERKKKQHDAKKQVRMCKKELQERQVKQLKSLKDQKVELRRKANSMSKIVMLYWKSVEKVVRHNYQVQLDKKRQQVRASRLENFVRKHLKLSVRVAEKLNTHSFVEQSMYKQDGVSKHPQLKELKDKPEEVDQITEEGDGADKQMTNMAELTVKMAEAFAPTGFTLQSAKVQTQIPFLLRGELREYQIIGLDWLITLHNKRLNGILADEMGLGKTIQTISMIASLACDKGIWGPHLIVVPTTIIINWEMEFKRWCPALKILTYFGSQKERKLKRMGWSKENSFHVCITSYKLVIQDHFAFRRKKWYYMILDEAQNIKNFKSQRWQTLLRFNTRRRLLLTGTPLQNDVMELWSLMHFLMPQIFSNQQDFKEWFSNPFSQSINQNQSLNIGVVQKLQSILRPFLLRRMKKDVEKQLPEKVEHIVQCNLSRRQRLLYDEYINMDKTKETLADADFFSIMNVLMQLRKVCNHPDLFESRTIESPFIMSNQITFKCPQLIQKNLIQFQTERNPLDRISFEDLNLLLPSFENLSRLQVEQSLKLFPSRDLKQAYLESFLNAFDSQEPLGKGLQQQRLAMEGQAMGKLHYTNYNLLHESNTQNLKHTIPKILPELRTQSSLKSQEQPRFKHQHPSYLNVACLPFAQNYFSLNSYSELADHQTSSSTPTKQISVFQEQEQRNKTIALGKKLLALAHFDLLNRRQLLMRKPIFGSDLRKSVKVNLLFDDLHETKRHKYVTKKSKYLDADRKECFQVTSAVFNPYSFARNHVVVSDFIGDGQNPLIQVMQAPEIMEIAVVDADDFVMPQDDVTESEVSDEIEEEKSQVINAKDQGGENDDKKAELSVNSEIRKEPSEALQKQNEEEFDYQICFKNCDVLRNMITTPVQRGLDLEEVIKYFKCIIPKAVARTAKFTPTHVDTRFQKAEAYKRFAYQKLMSHRNVNQSLKYSNFLFFPHKNLIQYDCGKLQKLAQLLKMLYLKGSKVLIFTQMTRMLDVLENFLNLHGYTYVRLDGSVKVENRQKMVDRFNLNKKIFCFISSTRCGGIGINLTGADCVVFYDTDWNPAMDKQAQDRCHRIGQTKTVHIYRLISINTVEENIFKKSLQKRELGGLIIEGNFNSEIFQKVTMKDLLAGTADAILKPKKRNLMQEENIVFHHAGAINEFSDNKKDDAPEDLDKLRELELYRRRFEEAMIRIEDQEDIEAYKEAKAEIDDEFDEDDINNPQGLQEPKTEKVAQKEDAESNNDEAQELEPEKETEGHKQVQMDQKNANSLSRNLQKSEAIDWRNHPTLNQVTKYAIAQFEQSFHFSDFMEDINLKEAKLKQGKQKQPGQKVTNLESENSGSDDSNEDDREDEDEEVNDWNRGIAESFYNETKASLEAMYNNLALQEQITEF